MKRGASIWWGLAALAALSFIGRKPLGWLFSRMVVRVDPSGDGHFGAVRHGHAHEGVDVLAVPGTWVSSPVDGIYVGKGLVYSGDPRFQVVKLKGDGYLVELMYVRPFDFMRPGDPVVRGQSCGVVQDIVEKYGPPMLAHVHVEVRTLDGELVDPEPLLPWSPVA